MNATIEERAGALETEVAELRSTQNSLIMNYAQLLQALDAQKNEKKPGPGMPKLRTPAGMNMKEVRPWLTEARNWIQLLIGKR